MPRVRNYCLPRAVAADQRAIKTDRAMDGTSPLAALRGPRGPRPQTKLFFDRLPRGVRYTYTYITANHTLDNTSLDEHDEQCHGEKGGCHG